MGKVTANNREIACKARPGMTTAFPDVCFTLPPPTPPPTGAPIPYPNVAFGATLAPCTFTVFNSRKTTAVFPRACLSTSVGDEAGMTSPKKGIVTTSVKGSARFVSCSFNVLFELFPVCRLMDLATHNHLSVSPVPPNTPPGPYVTGGGKGKSGKCKSLKCRLGRIMKVASVAMTALSIADYAETMDDLAHGEDPNEDGSVMGNVVGGAVNLVTGGGSGGDGPGQQG